MASPRRASIFALVAVTLILGRAIGQESEQLIWKTLPDLPNPVGVAGPFAGTHDNALIVAGGANFPDGMPWRGGTKVFHDTIYVFADGHWNTVDAKLPGPLAYGVSISTDRGMICIGGQSAEEVSRSVFRLRFDAATRTVSLEELPPLPEPLSFAGGARVRFANGRTHDAIYVVGGQHETGGSPGNVVFRLDLTREAEGALVWETLTPMPGPRRGLPVVAALDGSLYVFSGRDYGPAREGEPHPFAYHTDLLRFDTEESKWTDPRPILTGDDTGRGRDGDEAANPLCVMAGTAIESAGRILLVGGASGEWLEHGLKLDESARADFNDHHPGFSRDVLAFTPGETRVRRIGQLHAPHLLPVTTTAVRFEDRIVLPSGEVSPGKRSPRVWTLELRRSEAEGTGFGTGNWVALIAYLLGMVFIGVRCSKNIKGTDEFFLAGRKIPWWAAGLSIFGTQLSAITFMSIPATTYAGDWVRSIGSMTLLVTIPIVIFWYLPVFRGLQLSTAYEYLERRFGSAARTLAASLFILMQLGRMGIVLFLPAIALAAVTGIDVQLCIILMGVLCIIYTVLGGIEAVIWTDVAQVIVLMGGALLALCIAIVDVGGVSEVLRLGQEADKFRIIHHGTGIDTMTLPVMVIGLLFLNLVPYTSDQTVVQRYLTTANQKSAARSLWTNFWMTAPTGIIFFGLGTALYAFYASHPDLPTPAKNDEIVPWFVVNELPAGIAGVVIAAIFAASMSSLDSSMNSVSTVMIFDFYRRWHPDADDRRQLRLGRILTLVLGVLGTGTALVMASVDIKFLFDVFNKILGLFGGALAGMFFLGIFCRRVGSAQALTGTLAGALTVGALEAWNLSGETVVNPYLFATFGFVVCVGVGNALSVFNSEPST